MPKVEIEGIGVVEIEGEVTPEIVEEVKATIMAQRGGGQEQPAPQASPAQTPASDYAGAGVPPELIQVMEANGGKLPDELAVLRRAPTPEELAPFLPGAAPQPEPVAAPQAAPAAAPVAAPAPQQPAEPAPPPAAPAAQEAVPGDMGNNVVDDFARGYADTAAFGWADEIAANADIGSNFLKNMFATGGDVDESLKLSKQQMKSYEEQLTQQRERDRQSDPTARLAGQIGGAVLTPAGPMGALAKGGGLLKTALTGAAAGGVGGALYGAGASEGDRLVDSVIGGGLGMAGGAVAGPAVNALSKFANSARAKFSGKLGHTRAQRRAIQKLAERLKADEISYEDAMFRINNMAENDILPDIMGENVKGLAAGVASSAQGAKNKAVDFFTNRAMGQADEAGALVAKTMGESGDNIAKTMGDLVTKQQARATKLYGAAKEEASSPEFAASLKSNKAFQKFIREPVVKEQLAQIFKDRPDLRKRLELDKPIKRGDGTTVKSRVGLDPTDYQTLHELHKYLVQAGKVAKKEARTYTQEATDSFRSTLRDFMADAGSPSYREAVNAYAGDEAAKEAVLLGRKILNTDDFVTNEHIKKLSASERRFFTIGAASSLVEKALSSASPQGAAKTLMRNKKVANRLKPLFPSDAAYDEFISGIDKLVKQSETMARVNPTAGSKTAMLTDEMADSKDVHRFMRDLFLFQSPTMAVGLGAANIATKAAEKFSGLKNPALGDMLFTPGQGNAANVLESMQIDELVNALAGEAGFRAARGTGIQAGDLAAEDGKGRKQ